MPIKSDTLRFSPFRLFCVIYPFSEGRALTQNGSLENVWLTRSFWPSDVMLGLLNICWLTRRLTVYSHFVTYSTIHSLLVLSFLASKVGKFSLIIKSMETTGRYEYYPVMKPRWGASPVFQLITTIVQGSEAN